MNRQFSLLASIGLTACIVLPPGGYGDSETGTESDGEAELECTSDVVRYCVDNDVVIHDNNGCFEDLTEDCVEECDDGTCSCLLTSTCTADAAAVVVSCTAVVGQEPQEQLIECPFGCESVGDQAACKTPEDCLTTTCIDDETLLVVDECGNDDPLALTCQNGCAGDACIPCDGTPVISGCAFGYLWSFDGCGLTLQACINGCNPDTASCNP